MNCKVSYCPVTYDSVYYLKISYCSQHSFSNIFFSKQVMLQTSQLAKTLKHSILQKIMPEISSYVESVLSIISSNGDQIDYEKNYAYLEDSDSDNERTSEYQTLIKNFEPLPVPNLPTERDSPKILEQLISKLCSEFIELPDMSDIDAPKNLEDSFEKLLDDLNVFKMEDLFFGQQKAVDLISFAESKRKGITKFCSILFSFLFCMDE